MNTNGILSSYLAAKGMPRGTCPLCGKGKNRGAGFFLNDKAGTMKCFHCGFGGGVSDVMVEVYFGQSLIPDNGELDKAKDFYKREVSNKAIALKAMEIYLGLDTKPVNSVIIPKESVSSEDDKANPECDIERRNRIYRKMQELLPLDSVSLKSLLDRGYTKKQIEEWGYCSLPKTLRERQEFTAKLIKATGDNLEGVPGFYEYKGKIIVFDGGFYNRLKGLEIPMEKANDYYLFLCPSYDLQGRLQYFQIAFDKKMSGKDLKYKNFKGEYEERDLAKYTVFSTPTQPEGGKVKVNSGWVGPYKTKENGDKVPDLCGKTYLPIIEGVLKTHLYYSLIEKSEPAIAQVGVSNTNQLHDFLKELKSLCPQLEGIDDCYDMDKFTNESVKKACRKLQRVVEDEGLKYRVRTWNPNYKGADDVALAKKQNLL